MFCIDFAEVDRDSAIGGGCVAVSGRSGLREGLVHETHVVVAVRVIIIVNLDLDQYTSLTQHTERDSNFRYYYKSYMSCTKT